MIEARQERLNRPDGPGPVPLGPDEIGLAWPPELVERYASDRFVGLPGLLTPGDAQDLLASTRTVPSKRVSCGIKHVTWREQVFDPGHPAHDFFAHRQATGLVQALTGLEQCQWLLAWTSAYGLGEYINPHRDSSGTIQLLVCLQAPPDPVNGGELIVNNTRMFLRPGDAVAFEATSLEHRTTPLMATLEEPNPQRVVLVGRYFLA